MVPKKPKGLKKTFAKLPQWQVVGQKIIHTHTHTQYLYIFLYSSIFVFIYLILLLGDFCHGACTFSRCLHLLIFIHLDCRAFVPQPKRQSKDDKSPTTKSKVSLPRAFVSLLGPSSSIESSLWDCDWDETKRDETMIPIESAPNWWSLNLRNDVKIVCVSFGFDRNRSSGRAAATEDDIVFFPSVFHCLSQRLLLKVNFKKVDQWLTWSID